ncbi:MAG: CusA/CzcA family heavy metal efflux RND transporter [Parachlamydia sp.]|nr:MAG: CusA/CzcA family heavy metal efflux RND transporter [Parachlamydia sp.]
MIQKFLKTSLRYPTAIALLILAIALYGFYCFTQLPIDAVPDITNNQVQVNAILPGYSPLQMEQQVTYVIETALAGIPGLQMTRSLTRNAFAQVTAIFDDNMSIYFARQQINERLSEIKDALPKDAEIKMGPVSTGLGEVYMWTVDFKNFKKSSHPAGTPGWQQDGSYLTEDGQFLKTDVEKLSYLRMIQDWVIKPQLKEVRGLAGVDSIGGYVRQYHVEPNIEQMIALGLSYGEIIESLKKNNTSIGPGYLERGGEAFLIKSDERLTSMNQIQNIVIATREGVPIRISDIAAVKIGKEMRTGSASKNGHEVVVGTALMLIGANSRTVAQNVDQKLQEINQILPPDIEAQAVINRTKLVNATITTVVKNLGEGALLVILILFLFLGQMRAALITAAVIPLSMLMTAIGMMHANISGNLMSLGAIDFGLIVDGAVIITENCLRKLVKSQKELGRPLNFNERAKEILSASQEMIKPTIFGQAIIMTVYVPILALSGVEGKMFHPMAITVLCALLSAFILSVTFIPAMILMFVKGPLKEHENKIVEYAKAWYAPLLAKSLDAPKFTGAIGAVIVLVSFWIFTFLGQEFIPKLDEHDIAMHAMRIPSTSLSQSTTMQEGIEKIVKDFPEVAYVYSKTGTAEVATDPMPPNVSDTFIMLKPRSEWPDPSLAKSAFIQKLEKALKKNPGNNYEFTQPIEMRFNELISGVRSDVAVKIYGDNFDEMQSKAQEIAALLRRLPGAADVKVAQTKGLPVLDVKIDREAASRLGLNVSDGLEVLSIATGGGKAGQISEGDRRFDILVKLPEELKEINVLERLPIPLPVQTQPGKSKSHFPQIPLNEIAQLKIAEGLNEIRRENGKRFVSVQANVRGSDLGTFVKQAKQEISEKIVLPKGSWIGWGGQFENLLSARLRLMLIVPLCLALILLLLYAAFQSFKDALLVFSGVPFALTGGIFSLWLRGFPFSISAAVGMIALSGIAVLNGIVLISAINRLKKESMSLHEAITQGALMRLRPVLMTALVASLGFIPMALAAGMGAEVQKPLATVVIGGLISSTLLTLLILPALYTLFAGTSKATSLEK